MIEQYTTFGGDHESDQVLEHRIYQWAESIKAGLATRAEAEDAIIAGKDCPFVFKDEPIAPDTSLRGFVGTRWMTKDGRVHAIGASDVANRKGKRRVLAIVRRGVRVDEKGKAMPVFEAKL